MPLPSRYTALAQAVQRNCDRIDAVHAQDLSLCIYLLQMREFYRWERQLELHQIPERGDVGRWIAARESQWDALSADALEPSPLPLCSAGVDAFDETAVNRQIDSHGLVYAAGVGVSGRAVFMLAERESRTQRDGATVTITGAEHARGMHPPIATSRGDQILVRGDVLRRWLATRLELSQMRPSAEGLAAARDAWAAPTDPSAALESIALTETESVILHELGEIQAGRLLGEQWETMLASLQDRRVEIIARAVRDLLADCLLTLPELLDRDARGSLHFWFANLEGMRRVLAPDLFDAYLRWRDGSAHALTQAVAQGAEHWLVQAREMLMVWQQGGAPTMRVFSEALVDAANSRQPRA
ncbi:MAG: Sfum_1244 family protein [Quisquiliibacterium sp.]